MKNKKNKVNIILNIVLMIISVGIIAFFCIHENNLINLLNSIPGLNLFWLIFSISAILICWITDCKIIHVLTKTVYDDKYRFGMAFKITMVGQYFTAISPLGLASQPMQILAMTRQGFSSGIAISVLIKKFLTYQIALTLYSLVVIILNFNFFQNLISGFMTLAIIGLLSQAAVVILLFFFSTNRKLTTKLIKIFFNLLYKMHIIKNPEDNQKKAEEQLSFYLKTNKSMNKNRNLNTKLYLLTFLQLTILFSIPFFIYKSFHYADEPYFSMLSAQSFVTMISSYTPLPGASGTSEGSFIVIFEQFFKCDDVKRAMLLWRFITYYSLIIAGAFFVKFGKKHEKFSLASDRN